MWILTERRCRAWAVGRREQGRTQCRNREAKYLANKSIAAGGKDRRAGFCFFKQSCLLKNGVIPAAPGTCIEGVSLSDVIHAWSLYLHRAFLELDV